MDDSVDEIPRAQRTPITDAGAALQMLADVFDGVFPGPDEESFIPTVFGKMWNDEELDPDAMKAELKGLLEEDETNGPIGILMVSTAYAVLAMKCEKQGRLHEAWTYAVDAMHSASVIHASYVNKQASGPSFAVLGANAKHAENRALKKLAIDHYLANVHTYESKDAAAEEISRSIVPVKFRTVRDWLRGLRPAGRA